MAENSNIEWCDHTFNPWEGCTKVSPGCANCYAEARNVRFRGGENWGKGKPRRRTSAGNWKLPLRWNKLAEFQNQIWEKQVSQLGGEANASAAGYVKPRRKRVFCASLADWLDDEVPLEWLADLLDVIRLTPHLDWLLLTKRPQNWRARVTAVLARAIRDCGESEDKYTDEFYSFVKNWAHGRPPQNVWLGATVEDRKRADERIPSLLMIPAKIRFLSCEPLLEAVIFPTWPGGKPCKFVDWVICGGESGKGARPMHPDWARSLRDQCREAGVPFLFKQWGEWGSVSEVVGPRAHHYSRGGATVRLTGKKLAGSLLDGIEHNEFPTVEVAR